MLRCRRRRRRRCGRDVMIRWEDAQFEFGANGGVGRGGSRKFQIGGVLQLAADMVLPVARI